MSRKCKMYIVSHTHWDREWGCTFQQFRMKLVKLIDGLLDILDTNPKYRHFMLDGQTIILEDYLEIRPKAKKRLKNHLQQKRIIVGPWYVLPDEFLVSAESLIRNLMLGKKVAEKLDGEVMPVGYLPDQFGHISQIPQILKGFGIESAVIWRGVPEDFPPEFNWKSPDGSQVLAIRLPYRSGYCSFFKLSWDIEKAFLELNHLKEELKSESASSHLLVMNGFDHTFPQPGLPQILEGVNTRLRDAELLHSNLPEYIDAVKGTVRAFNLKTYRGEFRSTDKASGWRGLFFGVLSSRLYLKQLNEETQALLEKIAEPLATFCWMLGQDYPGSFLWQAWKYLLQNHPHDSICGCSIDEVHQDMEARFKWSKEIAGEVTSAGLGKIAEETNTSYLQNDEQALLVFNPLNWLRTDLVEATISLPQDLKTTDFVIRDEEGRVIPYCAERISSSRYKITSQARDIPPCGYKILTIIPGRIHQRNNRGLVVGHNVLENKYIRVEIHEDGSLTITDKKTGVLYKNCGVFEDGGDAGDEYNYSPPIHDEIFTTTGGKSTISLVKNCPFQAEFKIETDFYLPESLVAYWTRRTKRKVNCRLVSLVGLASHSPRVDIVTRFHNRAKDHRLRVLFPSGIKTDYAHAEGQFGVVRREIRLPDTKGWNEQASPTQPD